MEVFAKQRDENREIGNLILHTRVVEFITCLNDLDTLWQEDDDDCCIVVAARQANDLPAKPA